MSTTDYYEHLVNKDFMSGITRSELRIKATGEFFTPTELVDEILDSMDQTIFTDPTKTFLDPACGDGQFLANVLYRKLQNGIDFEKAIGTVYGVDLMPDNVLLCRERLLCGNDALYHVVKKNIICANALYYNYKFDGSKPDPMDLFDKLG